MQEAVYANQMSLTNERPNPSSHPAGRAGPSVVAPVVSNAVAPSEIAEASAQALFVLPPPQIPQRTAAPHPLPGAELVPHRVAAEGIAGADDVAAGLVGAAGAAVGGTAVAGAGAGGIAALAEAGDALLAGRALNVLRAVAAVLTGIDRAVAAVGQGRRTESVASRGEAGQVDPGGDVRTRAVGDDADDLAVADETRP